MDGVTPRCVVARDGTAQLLRFRRPDARPAAARAPLLLVPSLINRWYILDLRPAASLVGALVDAGLDVFCLDWGVPNDEDRYLGWDDVLARLARMVRATRRAVGAGGVGLLGYCMGGTLAAIHAALHPAGVAALVNLAGPIDFSEGGLLSRLTDRRWFDAEAVAAAGNVQPWQLQSGFAALRPTLHLAKWVTRLDRAADPAFGEAFSALEGWSNDNVPFPAAAYGRYVRELYQDNELVAGEHRVAGRRVDLAAITCPVLTVAAERDNICPLPAARALTDRCGTADATLRVVPGGHIGAVVGGRATRETYPALVEWLGARLGEAEAAGAAL